MNLEIYILMKHIYPISLQNKIFEEKNYFWQELERF
jgi:hypothetical protein